MTVCALRGRWLVAVAVVMVATVARAEDPVLVSITGPLVGRVGERASFEVELVNRSGKPLQQLRVIDYFDKGYHHEASTSPIEQKGTIDLMPGTARRLTLDFLLDEPGRQCHRVEILDQAHVFVGGATHCVEVQPAAAAQRTAAPNQPPVTVPPVPAPVVQAPPAVVPPPLPVAVVPPLAAPAPLAATPVPVAVPATVPLPASSTTMTLPATPAVELDLQGPSETLSDGVVEYVATVRNKGAGASPPMTLEFSWDDAFIPLKASDGFAFAGAKVSWPLPAIEPGGQLKKQINLQAKAPANAFRDSPATRACVRAVLGGLGGGAMVADEACVLVTATAPRPRLRTPAEAGLKLSLADLDDPVRPGDSTTLVCTVTNGGTEPSGRLDLRLDLPDGARPDADRSAARVRIENSRIAFDPIQPIPPGGQRSFEITYRLPAGGTGRASAVLSSADLDGIVERSCQTSFLE